MRPPRLLPWLGGLLALYLAAPLAAAALHAGQADWRGADWPTLVRATVVSLASATVATALVTLTGVPLGYRLARRPGRTTAALGTLVQLPLALPPLASGILLLFLIGYASPLGRATGGALTDSFAGIVLAEAFVAAPFLIIAARSAFAAADPTLEQVAATLGLSPAQVFRLVSLPLAGKAIAAGMLLAWLRAFGEFGATVMVAYHPYSLPIYTYVAFGSQGLPAMLPVLLPTLLAALLAVALAGRLAANRPATRPIPTAAEPPPVVIAMPAAAPPPGQPIRFAVRHALDGFHLDVAWATTAKRLAILGASGSGKSMTLRSLAGLGPPGTLRLGQADLSSLPPERRGVAYVPQGYGLFPHLPVERQLRLAVGHQPADAHRWLQRLGLVGLEQRRPAQLSLGQQQRVALARALIRPAQLLLLDEPFSALDAPLRTALRQMLLTLQGEVTATTILVTHDPDEAFLLADELLVIADGQVLQAGPAEAIFLRPANAIVARLLGAPMQAAGNALEPHRIDIGHDVAIAVAGPPLQPGARLGWSVRPDAVHLVAAGGHPARITRVHPTMAGRRMVDLTLGEARLQAFIDPAYDVTLGGCLVTVAARSIQVWRDE